MKSNPFKLDANDAIRNPSSMPIIMKRAIANIMIELKTGKRGIKSSNLKDPGTDYERFISAFNIISTSFTRNNIILGRQGSLSLTGAGKVRQNQLHRNDEKSKEKYNKKMTAMTPKQRQTARNNKKWSPKKKLNYLDRIMTRLKDDIESGNIIERQS